MIDLPGLCVRIWCGDNVAGESKAGAGTLDNDDMDANMEASASNDGLGPTGDFIDIEQNEIEMLSRGSSASSGVGVTSINFIIAASTVGLATLLIY